jgi:hypothetical protein
MAGSKMPDARPRFVGLDLCNSFLREHDEGDRQRGARAQPAVRKRHGRSWPAISE